MEAEHEAIEVQNPLFRRHVMLSLGQQKKVLDFQEAWRVVTCLRGRRVHYSNPPPELPSPVPLIEHSVDGSASIAVETRRCKVSVL